MTMSLPFSLFSFDTLAEHWFLSLAVRKWWECSVPINHPLKTHTSALYCSTPTFCIVALWWPLWTDSMHFFPAFWFVTRVPVFWSLQYSATDLLGTLYLDAPTETMHQPIYLLYSHFLEIILSIFSSSNTFLLCLLPCCALPILALSFSTSALSFFLSLNIYPDFPWVFVCYPEDTGSRLLEKICKFLPDCTVSHPRKQHSS